VCNAGDHDEHGSYKRPHLAPGRPVVIPNPDMVSEVQFDGVAVTMLMTSDWREMNGLGTFPHDRTAGGSGTIKHLVRIVPVNLTSTTTVQGCLSGKNTLKISFCSADEGNGQWTCRPPAGDYGDTHVQN